MKSKVCTKCKLEKSLSEFHRSVKLKDGFCCRCKLCIKKYQLNNRTHILAKRKEYRINNQHKIIKHREIYKTRARILNKRWQKINREKRNLRQKERLKTDINFKLARNLRGRVRSAIIGKIKFDDTLSLVGCSVEQLKIHLEKQFTRRMSWKNYGKWHIDHIRPCSSFDLSDPQQQRTCFNYSNLQPLWAKDNLNKSNKLDWSKNK
jgi:hypothetical protein